MRVVLGASERTLTLAVLEGGEGPKVHPSKRLLDRGIWRRWKEKWKRKRNRKDIVLRWPSKKENFILHFFWWSKGISFSVQVLAFEVGANYAHFSPRDPKQKDRGGREFARTVNQEDALLPRIRGSLNFDDWCVIV